MDWTIVTTSVLAGGIVGQVITMIGTNYLTDKREHKKWRLTERHKAINNILDLLTSDPKNEDLDQWTHKIRNASLKIHILYSDGTAPQPLANALETVFGLAKNKKNDNCSGTWSSEFRDSVSALRKQLSKYIDVD